MNKEENKKIIAPNKKIVELQEKLNNAIQEKNKLVENYYANDIKGKFIRIIYKDGNFNDLNYIKEYINVEDIYIDSNDNITYSGKGFKYEDGEYIDDKLAIYNEMYQSFVTNSEINNGIYKISRSN